VSGRGREVEVEGCDERRERKDLVVSERRTKTLLVV